MPCVFFGKIIYSQEKSAESGIQGFLLCLAIGKFFSKFSEAGAVRLSAVFSRKETGFDN